MGRKGPDRRIDMVTIASTSLKSAAHKNMSVLGRCRYKEWMKGSESVQKREKIEKRKSPWPPKKEKKKTKRPVWNRKEYISRLQSSYLTTENV